MADADVEQVEAAVAAARCRRDDRGGLVDLYGLSLTPTLLWSSQSGAQARHVAGGAALMQDEQAAHYWDPERRVGAAFQALIPGLGRLDAVCPGLTWSDEAPLAPTWWEHQLSSLAGWFPDRRLDPDRFAEKAVEMSAEAR